ncbi:ATP-binding protein [Mycoplasmopsis agassizii]|uniref:ATP-binding protein n=1 Tax=Mycoplasmopsis agassizii TaxID=33922 RepID=A0ABX4H5B4_9BACT|nr:ATP-binding protein [Mycoplasmopsis agassizii]PAF55081.1 hypothetical protein CJF60_00110 [Mycoplasmopsis agassizii]SMC19130.1 Histidine kinase-, DNA gyrase B-, and HSP90-like ATPase [Mycoplasmopsis agassizii]
MEDKKIDIRPTTGIYATYKHLTYEPWTAIAEFVDNSTQSYFDNRSELRSLPGFGKLIIDIKYDVTDKGEILTIHDNAYGMDLRDFKRAIRIDKPPLNTSGRNEFGMGLKTAACWFGSKWTLESTRLGEKIKYTAVVDVEKLSKTHDDYIDYTTKEVDLSNHYTTLTITNLNKKITGPRTTGKVKGLLASIYRQDLRNKEIIILYNGEELSFEEADIYTTIEDGKQKIWKKDINFEVEHQGKSLPVKGFVAIRQKGSIANAGLVLLRRNRVIIGGSDQGYRPTELFGLSNSKEYQRIFGELHMDKWVVTQAKNNFDWHNDDLEEKFIEKIKPLIKDFIDKAAKAKFSENKKIDITSVTTDIFTEFEKSGSILNWKVVPSSDESVQNYKESLINSRDSLIHQENYEDFYDDLKQYNFQWERNGKKYNLQANYNSNINHWILVKNIEGDSPEVTVNLKHKFFENIDNEEVIRVVLKLALCMVIAELESISLSTNGGGIPASQIRNKMNSLLEESLVKIKKE